MSDERLRELERQFRETGTVEDEAAWLRERVRVGDLPQERLELAAYLGDASSRRVAAGEFAPFPPARDLRRWLNAAPGDKTALLWRAALCGLLATSGECARRLTDGGPTLQELTGYAEAALRAEPLPVGVGHAHALVGDAAHLLGQSEFANQIQAVLVPWALGYGDPLRDRVEAQV